ncbi:hypothetical protein [uncultured Pseudoalteromonas sp.]|uniref:hypothetical protein n=1 Tax=uncultured Pseudoalteromonas sp. TaxID=114053 RepID=UPI002598AA80|nr:hypothetical protein [uncultured Pseudoalteromonas sp.]
MHILAMLLGMIIGLSIGTNLTWFLGLPVMLLSLLCLNMGSAAWRERQEAFALFFGLCCGALIFVSNLIS